MNGVARQASPAHRGYAVGAKKPSVPEARTRRPTRSSGDDTAPGTGVAAVPAAPGRASWALPLLVAVAFLARAMVLWQLHAHPLLQPAGDLDDAVYVRLAQRVAAGDWGIGPEVYYLSPFYTYFYFVALIFAVTGGSPLAVRIVQIALGAAAVGLIHAMARLWFGAAAAAVAGALAALTGLFAFYEILLLQSAVDPFLTALALYALTRAVQSPGVRWTLATGVALGLLSLNRPNALPFIAVAGCGMFAVTRSREGVVRAGALVLAAALTIAPATVRNRVVAGEWVLITSHGGLNFYIGNSEGADGTWAFVEGVTPSIAVRYATRRPSRRRPSAGRSPHPRSQATSTSEPWHGCERTLETPQGYSCGRSGTSSMPPTSR